MRIFGRDYTIPRLQDCASVEDFEVALMAAEERFDQDLRRVADAIKAGQHGKHPAITPSQIQALRQGLPLNADRDSRSVLEELAAHAAQAAPTWMPPRHVTLWNAHGGAHSHDFAAYTHNTQ